MLTPVFTDGTWRLATPDQTLARISPHLAAMGITRAADVTGLDHLGIPTWCAIRPLARQVQVSNGKGLTVTAAKVSALMEAIEHYHAEVPPSSVRRASMGELAAEGARFLPVQALPDYRPVVHLTDRRKLDWVRGLCLVRNEAFWVPACAGWVVEPDYAQYSTNGLASGNHHVEATLHALYEVIERHAVARTGAAGLVDPKSGARAIDIETVPAGPVADLRDRLRTAGVSLVLIEVASVAPVSTFWAVLVDPGSLFACSRVNMGQGSHLSPEIAATRAITEAAQSRLTYIHGAREDLFPETYRFTDSHRRLERFFSRMPATEPWAATPSTGAADLDRNLEQVVNGLVAAGFNRIVRLDLTLPAFGIPVVKVIVPGLAHNDHFIAGRRSVSDSGR